MICERCNRILTACQMNYGWISSKYMSYWWHFCFRVYLIGEKKRKHRIFCPIWNATTVSFAAGEVPRLDIGGNIGQETAFLPSWRFVNWPTRRLSRAGSSTPSSAAQVQFLLDEEARDIWNRGRKSFYSSGGASNSKTFFFSLSSRLTL